MKEKFWQGEFGCCPRVLCKRQYVLPIATTEELNSSRVKIFWPRCQDIYVPRGGTVDLDGAYFGCYFPQSFMQYFPELFENNSGPEKYWPRLYGFRLLGKKGSNYELEHDSKGDVTNRKQVEEVKSTVILDLEKENEPIDSSPAKITDPLTKSVKKVDANNPELLELSTEIKC
jgi:hypothetical protein